ncbi:Aste57867_18805 [Aphanomyces stellatus]|uniref:Aste57867_18805 protein n=1 Tax=Aphanomyces stellatus TaxID=120398 RepID=A0A485LB39_9STRA|nr:hypothetical protein As57867_018741 [Aphanomyces stellatus]VFT95539.1 Aste57867_18805 [Aphanomyces stellatus]
MNASFKRNGRELSHEEKLNVVQVLQSSMQEGKLAHGSIKWTAALLKLHRNCVSKIWKAFKTGELKSKKTGRVGRKQRYTPREIVETVAEVPKPQRSTLRDIMDATGISLYHLHKNLKAGTIQRRSSRLKPLLTDANKLAPKPVAVLAESAAIGVGGLQESEFLDMYDVVHLDEKWFNADKDRRKVYLVADETPDRRACKSKRYIPKVMLLAAVARPRGNFDGKIGMWPFGIRSPAVRTSRNRPAGTMQTTLVSVSTLVYRDSVLNKVIPAIMEKFPSGNKRVVLQHDNATPMHRFTTQRWQVCRPTVGRLLCVGNDRIAQI